MNRPMKVLGVSLASVAAFFVGWAVGGVGMIVWASWHVMGERGYRDERRRSRT